MRYQFRKFFSILGTLMRQPVLTLLRIPDLKDYVEPLFFLLRWLIPIAMFFRYMLHKDNGLEWPIKNSFHLLIVILIFYLAYSEYRFNKLQKNKNATQHDWRVFTSWFAGGDIVFITLFYIIANSPRSDIPYLYVIPIVWSIMFMPLRNNLFAIIFVSFFFTIGAVITVFLASSNNSNLYFSELLLVIMPKVIFLPIIVLYLLWVHVKLKLSENMIIALFDKSPEGISFIGQKKTKQTNTLVDMQILSLNAAQKILTPSAKYGSESCRTEFMSYSKIADSPCPWCPASPVLDGDSQFHRSLTKTIFKPSLDSPEEISFFDASASFCNDEKDERIAAVKFVKDITPQVYSAYLAKELFLFDDEDEVLKKTAEYFRKMFKADFAKLAKYENDGSRLSITAQATKQHPIGAIVSGMPILATKDIINLFENCPSEIDIIEVGTDEDKSNCLFWSDYCIPESSNPSIITIARNLEILLGFIIPIKIKKSLWGVIIVNRKNNTVLQNFTQFDVLQAQMAAKIASVAIERIQMMKVKDESLKQYQASSKNSSDLMLLCSDMLQLNNYERIVALALIGTTCKLGLRYSRAIFLKYDNEQLEFKYGIGPITNDEARAVWSTDYVERITEYYSNANWFELILSNNLTRVGKDQRSIKLDTISDSVLAQALKDRQIFKGEISDTFLRTTLAMSLRVDAEFVVAPIYFESIVHGIMIADKKYLADERISRDEREQLLFLIAFTGACATGCKMDMQLKNVPLQFLTSIHELIKNKYHEKGIDIYQFVNLIEKLARAKGFSEEDVKTAKISALATNFVHLCFSDSLLFGEENISSDNKYFGDIRKHPESAEKLIRIIGGQPIAATAAGQHHILFDSYPVTDSSNLTTLAKMLSISESYIALVNPKKYKKLPPKSSNDAISELIRKVSDNDKELVQLLAKVIEDKII